MLIPEDVVRRLEELPIESVAEKLGLDVKKHKAQCFMHDDHNPSISFSTTKNKYRCWVCGEGGGPIKLVRDKEGLSFLDACDWLAVRFNIWWPEQGSRKKRIKRQRNETILPENPTYTFDREVFSWLIDKARLSEPAKRFLFEKRHFKNDVILRMNIKSVTYPKRVVEELIKCFGEERCLKSGIVRKSEFGLFFFFYTPCLIFPYYEQDGRLAGIQSRYIGESEKAPRFQFFSSQKTRVFNLPILNTLKSGDILYISEGITDCLALLSAGKNAVAIPSATILPFEDLVMLKSYDLHMYPDQDEAGQRAFMELRRFFVNHYSTVKADKLPEGMKDYCDYFISTFESNGERKD